MARMVCVSLPPRVGTGSSSEQRNTSPGGLLDGQGQSPQAKQHHRPRAQRAQAVPLETYCTVRESECGTWILRSQSIFSWPSDVPNHCPGMRRYISVETNLPDGGASAEYIHTCPVGTYSALDGQRRLRSVDFTAGVYPSVDITFSFFLCPGAALTVTLSSNRRVGCSSWDSLSTAGVSLQNHSCKSRTAGCGRCKLHPDCQTERQPEDSSDMRT